MSPEWTAAIAAIWAAIATTWAAIATTRAIIATRQAPIDATQLAAQLQESSERRRLKLSIFAKIMQHRSFMGELDCANALNIIDAAFFDVQSVRDAWAGLYAALNDKRNFPEAGPTPIIDEKRTALLSAIAADLGLSGNFRPDDFARIYWPTALSDDHNIRHMQRQLTKKNLSNQLQAAPSQGAAKK